MVSHVFRVSSFLLFPPLDMPLLPHLTPFCRLGSMSFCSDSMYLQCTMYNCTCLHCVGSRVQFVMGGRRASGPRWGAITVRRLLLCLLHASFNGFFTLLVSIAGNMGGAVHHGSSFFSFKMQFSLSAGGWCTTTAESELNATHPAWKGYIPHFSSIQHLW